MASQDSSNGCGAHILCVNKCGFFGTAANMNLCSKCYRDQLKADEQSNLAKAAFEKSANPKKALTTAQDSSGTEAKNRCFSCNKKLGLTAVKCKCGAVFCSAHRYPEKHSCEFDYKGVGREILAKLNPQVKADKIDRF
ncbi:hypothetical protein MKW92_012319 [Papaver armeniacum]|nr:hypothetical protein MKW92_012319 [Papaver armeniacum]